MNRPRSNALTANDARLPHWQDPNYRINIANAGPYRNDPSGYNAFYGTRQNCAEGWKFHISAYPHNAEALAQVVLPLFTRMNVWHKYLDLYKLRGLDGNAAGKFIAYYPISPRDAHTIELAIEFEFAHRGMRNLQGPPIQDELAFGNTGIIYTRYGGFKYEYIQGPAGTNTKSLDSARGRRAYHTGFIRPSWVAPLANNYSNAAFPSYDPRRTLHYLQESNQPWVN